MHTPVRLAEILNAYEMALTRRQRKRASFQNAQKHGKILMDFYGPNFNVVSMQPLDLEKLIAARLAAGAAPAYAGGTLRILRAAMGVAIDVGLLEALPFHERRWAAARPRIGRKDPSVLQGCDLTRLLAAAEEPVRTAMWIAARAGLRHQEILHLTVGDVRLEEGVIKVTPKRGWTPKAYHERTIPISPQLADVLRTYLSGHATQDPGAWLFPGVDQQRTRLDQQVRAVFKAAGLYLAANKPGLHMLRRTWATKCLAAGASLPDLMKMGGWSDLAVVQRYVASTDEGQRTAILALDGA